MIHEFQLKWKTYLLLYYAIPSVHRFRSQEKGALYPFSHIQNFISIFLFFPWRMWHICISLFSLIRICWLKLNEINSSWWHWIRLRFSLNTLHTVDSLITGSRSHTFVSTNVGAPSPPSSLPSPPLFFPGLLQLDSFLPEYWCSEICPWIIFQSLVYHFCLGSVSEISNSLWVFGIHSSFSSPAASLPLVVDPNRSLIEW